MTELRAVPPLASRPSRRVVIQRKRPGPLVWRSDTPVADWWAQWRPAVVQLAIRLFAVGIFLAAGWFLAVALLMDPRPGTKRPPAQPGGPTVMEE